MGVAPHLKPFSATGKGVSSWGAFLAHNHYLTSRKFPQSKIMLSSHPCIPVTDLWSMQRRSPTVLFSESWGKCIIVATSAQHSYSPLIYWLVHAPVIVFITRESWVQLPDREIVTVKSTFLFPGLSFSRQRDQAPVCSVASGSTIVWNPTSKSPISFQHFPFPTKQYLSIPLRSTISEGD